MFHFCTLDNKKLRLNSPIFIIKILNANWKQFYRIMITCVGLYTYMTNILQIFFNFLCKSELNLHFLGAILLQKIDIDSEPFIFI